MCFCIDSETIFSRMDLEKPCDFIVPASKINGRPFPFSALFWDTFCYHFGLIFDDILASFWYSFFDAFSSTVLTPFWSNFGLILDSFWALFPAKKATKKQFEKGAKKEVKRGIRQPPAFSDRLRPFARAVPLRSIRRRVVDKTFSAAEALPVIRQPRTFSNRLRPFARAVSLR